MRIGKYSIKKIDPRMHREEKVDKSLEEINREYERGIKNGKRLILGTLVARSGTRWLCDIFSAHKSTTGITERYVELESFYRYITFNKLAIDTLGIITQIKIGILKDWEANDTSLVFSPYFSHGLEELVRELSPEKVIFALAEPRFTVQSIYNKNIFEKELIRRRSNDALGPQPGSERTWSHFFGRIIPAGEAYEEWKKLTQIGKISWWGNQITMDIYQQVKSINKEKVFIFNLQEADQNYEYYKKMAAYFNLAPLLSERDFLALKKKTVRAADNETHQWKKIEEEEFNEWAAQWRQIYQNLCSKEKLPSSEKQN